MEFKLFKKIIPYSRQNLDNTEIRLVTRVLKSDFLTQGPLVEKFENEITNYTNSKYAMAVNSATSGLHLACMALGLKRNDYLWTTANSFVASANCGLYCGAKIDLVDIDLKTFNISLERLEQKLKKTNKVKLPKILIIVHFAGNPCEMKKLFALSRKYKFKIIEDASHALGAKYKNNHIGDCKFSDLCVFSFHPVKSITTAEGGMVTTNKKNLALKIKALRTHGIIKDKNYFEIKENKNKLWHYEQKYLGFNYRMNDVEAAIGIAQIKKIDKFIYLRKKIFNLYKKILNKLPLILPINEKECKSSNHLFIIRIDKTKTNKKRDDLFNYLRKEKIFVNIHYIPIYRHPYYSKIGFLKKNFQNCEKYYSDCLSIPIYPGLNYREIFKIKKILDKFFNKA